MEGVPRARERTKSPVRIDKILRIGRSRQAHRQIKAAGRSGLDGGLDDMLELVISDLRHHRSDGDIARYALVIERLHRRKALLRLRRARFKRARDLWVERSHRNCDGGDT